jgi:mannose-1-phosphate guanylyltransferase
VYAVILAGGGGTRLWPLSSPERPKPFLPLLGERTLLQLTAVRLAGLIEPASTYVITDRRYESLVREQVPDATVVAEPVGRNTAAAIALAAVAIDRPHDEVMLVLPADQTVRDGDLFRAVLRDAEGELALGSLVVDPLVTLGIQTARPAIEYGYLIPNLGRKQQLQLTAYVLEAFEEKPPRERAEALVRTEGVAWNAGIFMWQRRAIRGALEAFASGVLDLVELGFSAGTLDEAYAKIESISIDYAVMEPAAAAGQVVMGSMDVGWNDLGSWTSLLGELGMPGIEATIGPTGSAFEAAPDDLLVWRRASGRLVATPGEDATMVASDGPVAVLRGARRLQSQIEPLLDRCSTLEANS